MFKLKVGYWGSGIRTWSVCGEGDRGGGTVLTERDLVCIETYHSFFESM